MDPQYAATSMYSQDGRTVNPQDVIIHTNIITAHNHLTRRVESSVRVRLGDAQRLRNDRRDVMYCADRLNAVRLLNRGGSKESIDVFFYCP